MPHVEFSLTEPHLNRGRLTSLDRWAAAVIGATEPCLVVDDAEIIVAISAPFEASLGLSESAVGRHLLDGVLQLLDFADGGALNDGEIGKIPPLLALTSGRLARGLLRVRCAIGACTFDAIATPLAENDRVTGSLTFFSPV